MIEMIQYYENIEYNNPSFVKSYGCPFKAKQLINEIVKTQNLVTKIFGKQCAENMSQIMKTLPTSRK